MINMSHHIAKLLMNFHESVDVMVKKTDFASFFCDWCTGTGAGIEVVDRGWWMVDRGW